MYEGHAASDNFFACVDGDDILPDIAIGRLPIVEQGRARRHRRQDRKLRGQPRVASSRRTGRNGRCSSATTKPATRAPRTSWPPSCRPAASRSARSTRSSTPVNNKASVEALYKAFNEGQLLVHFIGHGGRYIWRTGPEDLKRNNDLFTLKDLDNLAPTSGFPFVMSLTCYSAPFDHPTADSIGEKLLRLPGKGAIAVLAAAWRNAPPAELSERIFEELQVPGRTIGEAVMAGKRRSRHDRRRHQAIQPARRPGPAARPAPAASWKSRNR